MQRKSARVFRTLVVLALLSLAFPQYGYADSENFEVTPGVEYEEYKDSTQAIQVMEVDLTQPHLDLGLGMDENYPNTEPISEIAKDISEEGNRVVGGVNGSFFYMDFKYPTYLMSIDGNLFNLGTVAGSSGYMQDTKAFGMTNDGRGLIGDINLDIEFTANDRTFTMDKFNQDRGHHEKVLYTPSNYHYTPDTNEWGVEIYVHNVDKPIDSMEMSLGDTITGEVKEIRPYNSGSPTNIPSDGYVISVHGESDIADGLSVGDEVELTVDVENEWKDTEYIIASGPMLVNDGQVARDMIPSNSVARTKAPRTAVGINEDGSKVYLITVDGRQVGYSEGMSLIDFANYLEGLGIEHALNLDGGGSTTMVAREYGDVYPSVMNSPSGGYERSVINGLFAIVNQESGVPEKINFERDEEGKVVVGASFDVDVNYVLDEFYHPLEYTLNDIQFSVDGDVGRFTGDQFIAETPGVGKIHASMGPADASLPVEVIQAPDEVRIAPQDLSIALNRSQTFEVDARMSDGSPVIWDPEMVNWSTINEIGTIDENGEFTASSDSVAGQIVASINGKDYETNVAIGGPDKVVESFEDNLNWVSSSIGNAQLEIEQVSEKAAVGGQALSLSYQFEDDATKVSAVYDGDQIYDRPEHIGMWVHGDIDDHNLGLQITDSHGTKHQLDLIPVEADWDGWQYVAASVPESIQSPFKIDQIMLEKADGPSEGQLFIDKMVLSFDENNQTLEDLENYETVSATKEWKVTFDKSIDPESVNENSIFVEDVHGDKHEVTYELNEQQTVITVSPTEAYTSDEFYRLVINENVQGENGFNKLGQTDQLFKVE
ncbi:phosphodiester glycosidase family protein [Tenuibacillus multivorans]|uniref:Ig-like domain-containing protein n=1 Tax=Tenuibacillus multivorans TaxID=237069 RepID=A0A1H0C078_9BACI|nr:phosphodiester glycosidase family protein [Tenuibacillus multivorans]GEL77713.1 hypothetical protein TMU01_19480 [Tenuibacillus multivorans]SDN51304.1 Ig-like domain-containing protein [Tenuibacillus multivorans]